MFFRLFRRPSAPRAAAVAEPLRLGDQTVPLLLVHNPRARRYLLRVKPDGTARVTIPRGGSAAQANQFVERSRGWLEQQLQKMRSRPKPSTDWRIGDAIWFRGEKLRLEAGQAGGVRVGSETIAVQDFTADLRPEVEQHLRRLAARELPPRVLALAQPHGFAIRRITVRNERSRWGSCSRRGTISLNWRLVQTPILSATTSFSMNWPICGI